MRNLRRWRSPDGSQQLYTCARPGRSKGKDQVIEDQTVHEWARDLPGGTNTVIVSLLGVKTVLAARASFHSTPPSLAIGISRKNGAGRCRFSSGSTGTTKTVAFESLSTRRTMASAFRRRRCARRPVKSLGFCQKAERSCLWIRVDWNARVRSASTWGSWRTPGVVEDRPPSERERLKYAKCKAP